MSGAGSARWELLRGLGGALVTPAPGNAVVLRALDLPVQTAAEYTEAFVLGMPPHAAIHLGPEGKLGGDGLDRVAGFWRALGLTAPTDADHLGVLLLLLAELGEAHEAATGERSRVRTARARDALLAEHLTSWAPGYLAAVADLGTAPIGAWAELTAEALALMDAETAIGASPSRAALPAALRDAPPPGIDRDLDRESLLDAMTAPVRAGFPLTWRDLESAASRLGLGLRRGERRFALGAMLDQDPAATVTWLAGHAERWAGRHLRLSYPAPVARWWSDRASSSAAALRTAMSPCG